MSTIVTACTLPQSAVPRFPVQVFGIAGNPVAHDLGYLLHNKFFEASGVDAVYLPLLVLPPTPPINHMSPFAHVLGQAPATHSSSLYLCPVSLTV